MFAILEKCSREMLKKLNVLDSCRWLQTNFKYDHHFCFEGMITNYRRFTLRWLIDLLMVFVMVLS